MENKLYKIYAVP